MNIAALRSITGATVDRRQRVVIVAFWAALTSLGFVVARSSNLVVPMIAYAIGMGFWWAFVAGRTLLLQRDARALCLPEVDKLIVFNLLLQYAVTALLPALAMALATHADFWQMAALFSSIAAGALMLQMLPRALATVFSIVPAAMNLLNARGVIPGLTDPGFVAFGWTLAAAMLVVALWRWRSILAADPASFGTWSVPLVIQMQRRADRCGLGQDGYAGDGASGYSLRAGLNRQIVLDGIAAQTPTRALRVWLGGTFAPVAWQVRAMQIAFVLLPMLLPVVFHWITGGTITGWIVFTVVAVGMIVPLVTMSVAPARLMRLQADHGGELAQLALLPGVGGSGAKLSFVRAVLGVPVCACTGVYVFALIACLSAGAGGALIAALTLSTAGAIAFGVVQSLTLIAGERMPRIALHAMAIVGITLLCTTPVLLPLGGEVVVLQPAADAVLLGWMLLYVLLAWLAIRALRALARRPHAFLTSDR